MGPDSDPERSHSPEHGNWRLELYTKLVIAFGDFVVLVYFLNVHITNDPQVPKWVFLMLLSILGAMLGMDIWRGDWGK